MRDRPIKIEGYEPNDICRALGLRAFADDADLRSATGPAFRVLLTPSFSPEVCISMFPADDGHAVLDVRTFDKMLWHRRFTGYAPRRFAESARVARADADTLAARLYRCTQAGDRPPAADGWVVQDGMPVSAACWWDGGAHVIRVDGDGGPPAFAKLVRDVLRATRAALPVGHCRTAVAHAKKYL